MFSLAAFVFAAVGQELWRGVRARRAMSSDSVPRALVSLVQRNRRRYGGYLVHVGVAVLFAGVAASSAFQDARDVQLQVGQSAQGRRLRAHLRAADRQARGGEQRPAREDRPRRGDARLARTASRSARCAPSARSSPPTTRRSARSRASSRARRRARSACAPGCGATSGARSPRTCATCASRWRRATACSTAPRRCRPRSARSRSREALDGLTRSYAANPPAATFRLIVSPLVSWIWIGALIVFAGGLIALWPPLRRAPRPVAARYAARVARELGRA